jgi:hypothetical protein
MTSRRSAVSGRFRTIRFIAFHERMLLGTEVVRGTETPVSV